MRILGLCQLVELQSHILSSSHGFGTDTAPATAGQDEEEEGLSVGGRWLECYRIASQGLNYSKYFYDF